MIFTGKPADVTERGCQPFDDKEKKRLETLVTYRSDDNKNFGYRSQDSSFYFFWCEENRCNNFKPSDKIEGHIVKGEA